MRYFVILAEYGYVLLPEAGSKYLDMVNLKSSMIYNPESDFKNNCIHTRSTVTVIPDFKDQGFQVTATGTNKQGLKYWRIKSKNILGLAGLSYQKTDSTGQVSGWETGDAYRYTYAVKKSQFGWHFSGTRYEYDLDWSHDMIRTRRGSYSIVAGSTSTDPPSDVKPSCTMSEWSEWTTFRKGATIIGGPDLDLSWTFDYSESMASAHLNVIKDNWNEFWLTLGGYGELCQKAADNLKVDHINLIGLARDIINLPNDLDGLLDYAVKGRLKKKDIASLYLSGKYGVRLTVQDVIQTSKNATSRSPSKGTASATDSASLSLCGCDLTGIQWVTFDYRYDGFDQIWKRLNDASMIVSAQDLWDLVPYSFAIDWIFDISSLLEDLQDRRDLCRLNASNIWRSFKGSYSKTIESSKGIIQYEGVDYVRAGQHTLASPSLSLESPTWHKHIVESSALILQKL